MEILQRAIQAVQRNLSALGLYLVITVAASATSTAVYQALGSPEESAFSKGTLFLFGMGFDVCMTLVYAAAQAVVFSRFAKDIDRPLWRIRDDREALQRYFLPWLVLNACLFLLKQLSFDVPALLGNDTIGFFPSWLLLFAAAVYLPLGAAMMFLRTADWRNIGEALAPYRRQFGKTFALCCINGILFLFMLALVDRIKGQPWLGLLADIIFGYFDCVIFCAAWLICMFDRQTPENIGFDF